MSLGKELIFYDKYYESELARANLDTYLQDIYRNQCDLVVPFFCKSYERKPWCCKVEWQAIRSALHFENKPDDYLMPIRFDDTQIPGFLKSYGYVFVGNRSPIAIAELILNRINQKSCHSFSNGKLVCNFPDSIGEDFIGRDNDINTLYQKLQKRRETALIRR